MYDAGHSMPVHCDNLEEWHGEGGGGGGFKREGTYVYLCQFMLMYGKTHHNIVKQLSYNLKKKSTKKAVIGFWQ